MSKNEAEKTPLVLAAEALEGELRRFEGLSENLDRAPMNSQKSLQRAAEILKEVADIDQGMTQHVQHLVTAVTSVRARQELHIERIQIQARQLQQRTEVFQALLECYASLGQEAADLNLMIQEIASPGSDRTSNMPLIQGRMNGVIERAHSLEQSSTADGFVDIARQADSIRQQLMGARNKLTLLEQKLSSRTTLN